MTLFERLTGCYQANYYEHRGTSSQTNSYKLKLTGVTFSDGFRSEEEAAFINERVVVETAQLAVHF